jgi:hypothetical protein
MHIDLVISSSCTTISLFIFHFHVFHFNTSILNHEREKHHTIVSNELQARRQNSNKLLINQARDGNALEGTISGFDVVECAKFTLLDELFARAGPGLDNLGD